MMFEILKDRILKAQRDFELKLVHSTDVYDLSQILDQYAERISNYAWTADCMVRELENLDRVD